MPPPRSSTAAAADLAACRRCLSHGSKSFALASLLLPRQLRNDAAALYAFCRVADDAIDEGENPGAALHLLHRRLDDVYRGQPADDPVDRALSRVVLARRIPQPLLLALLEGFAWDAQGRQYASLSELTAYAVRVAGSVGVMMALLMDRRDATSLARAADLGVAMQFTNIARDVGEDAAAGRVYLPGDWLREAGVDAEALSQESRHTPALGEVVQRLLARAEVLYQRADSGIAGLPAQCRPAIYAARLLYAGIGDQLESQAFDAVSSRAILPAAGKLRRLLAVRGLPQVSAEALAAPVLPEAAYLLDAAVSDTMPVIPAPARGASRPPRDQGAAAWVLDLFAELEQRERQGSAGSISLTR